MTNKKPLVSILIPVYNSLQTLEKSLNCAINQTYKNIEIVISDNASTQKISKIYNSLKIQERHRHRYEVNINFKEEFEKKGMIFSGLSPDNKLPEIVELNDHPWFVGVQFHPEFKSRPLAPHPLFSSFIKAAKNNSKK